MVEAPPILAAQKETPISTSDVFLLPTINGKVSLIMGVKTSGDWTMFVYPLIYLWWGPCYFSTIIARAISSIIAAP
jgi:hypothetical protein